MSETGNTLQAVNMLSPNCSENQPILSSMRQKKTQYLSEITAAEKDMKSHEK